LSLQKLEFLAQRQLRALYRALLSRPDRFDEFRRLVLAYPGDGAELPEGRAIRLALNARIREWLGTFDGMDAAAILTWRSILRDGTV
jgi:hypothetical protein